MGAPKVSMLLPLLAPFYDFFFHGIVPNTIVHWTPVAHFEGKS